MEESLQMKVYERRVILDDASNISYLAGCAVPAVTMATFI